MVGRTISPRLEVTVAFEEFEFVLAAGLIQGQAYFLTRAGLNDAVIPGSDDPCCSAPDPLPHPWENVACWSCNRGLLAGRRVLTWGDDPQAYFERLYCEQGMTVLAAALAASETSESLASWRQAHLPVEPVEA